MKMMQVVCFGLGIWWVFGCFLWWGFGFLNSVVFEQKKIILISQLWEQIAASNNLHHSNGDLQKQKLEFMNQIKLNFI